MKEKLVFTILACLLVCMVAVPGLAAAEGIPFAVDSPLGFAIVDILGQNGITGGGNGKSVVVTNLSELRTYAASPEPLTIFVKGTIAGSSDVNVTSNKTIIGLDDDATLQWVGISANGAHNIIIRNLRIADVRSSSDAVALRNCHHVWIDHCELASAPDGLLDFTIGSDYLTVSWTIFRDHDKVSLLNSGTNHWEDHGKNKGTFYFNWFLNTNQRNPRIGYGLGHIFNNYYSNVTSYAIGTHTRAKILAENNYFSNTNNPFSQMYNNNEWDANYGDIEGIGNIFENSRGNMTGTGRSFDPGYYYDYGCALIDAAFVPAYVEAKAGPGAEFSHLAIPVPGNGAVDVADGNPELMWVDTREIKAWQVYFGKQTDFGYKATVTAPSFNPRSLEPDTVYFWRVDAETEEGTVKGELWRFRTAPAQASKPAPAHGSVAMPFEQLNAAAVKPVELSWVPGLNAVAHDVYLGTDPAPGADDYRGRVETTVFAPGRLQLGAAYFWRVDTVLADGTVVPGETWSFELPVAYAKAGRIEAENMVAGGRYFKEHHPGRGGAFIASNEWVMKIEAGAGSLSAVWDDPDAVCDITVAYLDQSTGRGVIALYVNDDLIERFTADKNTNRIEKYKIAGVQLRTGDEIRIEARSESNMLTRIDYLDIEIKGQ